MELREPGDPAAGGRGVGNLDLVDDASSAVGQVNGDGKPLPGVAAEREAASVLVVTAGELDIFVIPLLTTGATS